MLMKLYKTLKVILKIKLCVCKLVNSGDWIDILKRERIHFNIVP